MKHISEFYPVSRTGPTWFVDDKGVEWLRPMSWCSDDVKARAKEQNAPSRVVASEVLERDAERARVRKAGQSPVFTDEQLAALVIDFSVPESPVEG